MEKKKAFGQFGDWYAVVEGERLPCVHDVWKSGNRYRDLEMPNKKKSKVFASDIARIGKVILTKGTPITNSSGSGMIIPRSGYVAIWAIINVELKGNILNFDFVKQICELEN